MNSTVNFIKAKWGIFFLLIILFLGAWVRFDGISKQGIAPGDSFQYVKEARLWANGENPQFLKGRFYRPVSYFLQGKALQILGYNDYAIKILHGSMDIISIILIFVIFFLLTGTFLTGAAGVLMYSFLPAIVNQARWEMLHVESTFFSLWAFLFFILAVKRGKTDYIYIIYLVLSGINVGLAANTHPDMAFLAPGYVLFLLLTSFNRFHIREFLKKFIMKSFIFSASFFAVYALGFVLFGLQKTMEVILNEFFMCTTFMPDMVGYISKPAIFYSVFYNLLNGYFDRSLFLILALLAGAIFIIIYRAAKKEKDPSRLYLAPLLLFCYALCFCCFLKSEPENRILMHLVPLVIFVIVSWFHRFLSQSGIKYAMGIFVAMVVIIFWVNPKMLPGDIPCKSPVRNVYDILGQKVNSKNKLLIAPVIVWDGKGFQHEFYFDSESAIYLSSLPIKEAYNVESLINLLNKRRIRYVFVDYNDMQPVLLKPGCFIPIESLSNWLRNNEFQYSLEKDLSIIQEYIKLRKGILISDMPYGRLYILTNKINNTKHKQKIGEGE